MKLEQRLRVPARRDRVWSLLMDMARVSRCFPGVEQVTMVDEDNYQGSLRFRVGPATLTLSGSIVVLERDQDRWHAAMRLDGADRRVGASVRATMAMDLVEAAPQETELVIASDISFLGKLGELGQPVIRKKADSVIQEFARNLGRELAAARG